jgi:hypothetical protein
MPSSALTSSVAQLPAEKLHAITELLGLAPDRIVCTAQLTNGPVWPVLQVVSAANVLATDYDSSKIRYPQFLWVGLIRCSSERLGLRVRGANVCGIQRNERRPDHRFAERGGEYVSVAPGADPYDTMARPIQCGSVGRTAVLS